MNIQDLLEVRSRLLTGTEPTEVTIRDGKAELYCQKVPRRYRQPLPAPPIETPAPSPNALLWDGPIPDVIREPAKPLPPPLVEMIRTMKWEPLPDRRASPWHRGDRFEDNLCGDLTAFPYADAPFQFTAMLVDGEADETGTRLTFQALDPICIRGQEFVETLARDDAGFMRLSVIMHHVADCEHCRPEWKDVLGVPFRATMEQ